MGSRGEGRGSINVLLFPANNTDAAIFLNLLHNSQVFHCHFLGNCSSFELTLK